MVLVYDYYGLNVYFLKDISTPITIFAGRGNKESSILIAFKNGLVNQIEMVQTENPLDEEDQHTFSLIVEKNISEIVKHWLDTFVYNQDFSPEIIKHNIKEKADL